MLLLVIGIALLVGAVMVAVLVAFAGAGQQTGVARSLELLSVRADSRSAAKNELEAKDRLVAPAFEVSRKMAQRLSPVGTGDRIAASLDKAGNPPAWTVERVMGAKGIALVVGAVVPVVFFGLSVTGVLGAFGLAALMFFLPDLLVYNQGTKRQEELRKGLADALDMLTVCVEAGQGFDAAILQVARNVPGPIGGEFARVLAEIQIGKSRGEAFAGLGERTTVSEIKNFVSALVQADRLGLPIAAVLREQTKEMRVARRQRAEEEAQKVTVKILFPLIFFIFPVLMIVVIGPGIIRLVDAFTAF
ncbi:type II secretion system F family protein [Phycicoccus sp. BSK3Z-2]|uniref:Type II secretion system F family protein n=1 Tax=Phycicoccus avicenniae TaxID=2828860 RepID=A0A941D8V3_9MICO|nr:type II secretion system F family protein [Phycicoccus avicenniae]MBR7743905.1 type II secretion system F family protein [Phycicoccus avicenniae]